MPVVVESLLKLAALLKDVAQVGVSLGEEGVLFDGQSAEVGGSGESGLIF